jgi:predicted transcriptional regulator
LLAGELKRIRSETGVTQLQLAQRLKVPQSYVAKVEVMERRLDVIEFVRWMDALGQMNLTSELLAALKAEMLNPTVAEE